MVENNKARKGKKLWTEADAGDLIGLYGGYDSENEALFIADATEKYLAVNPGDHVAILYRTNSQSRQIEEALRRYGRKYNVVGGFSFYQRAEIKDTVAYLKLAASNSDSVSLMRVINTPARGIGRTTVEQIERYGRDNGLNLWDAIERIIDDQQLSTRSQSSLVIFRNLIQELSLVASQSSLPDLIRFILDRTGYRKMLQQEKTPESETRLENLDELINAAAEAQERGESVGDFLDHAALVADADSYDEQAPVTLMTLHNAKGLEFPLVFLSGHGTGAVPAQPVDEFRGGAGRRAAAVLRGDDARAQAADSDLGEISPALWRRRAGAFHAESWFLSEVPEHLIMNLGPRDDAGRSESARRALRCAAIGQAQHVYRQDLQFAGQHFAVLRRAGHAVQAGGSRHRRRSRIYVRRRNFRGPSAALRCPGRRPPRQPAARKGARTGMVVEHPKYGTGTVVRREGEGDDAKITVNFPRYGLKKLIEKYAGLKRN